MLWLFSFVFSLRCMQLFCFLSDVPSYLRSGAVTLPPADEPKHQQLKSHYGQTEEKRAKESRSQKHNRVSVLMCFDLKRNENLTFNNLDLLKTI